MCLVEIQQLEDVAVTEAKVLLEVRPDLDQPLLPLVGSQIIVAHSGDGQEEQRQWLDGDFQKDQPNVNCCSFLLLEY